MARSAVQDMTEDLQNQKEAYRVAKQGDERKPVETQTARDNEKEALAAQRKRQRERNPEGILEEPALGG